MIAALFFAACTPPVASDPAVGTWLCLDRWTGEARQTCPIEGRTWQLELSGSGDARLFETWVEDGRFRQTDLVAERLEPGAWVLSSAPEDTADTGGVDTAAPTELVWTCTVFEDLLRCAGSDASQTWEMRLARL